MSIDFDKVLKLGAPEDPIEVVWDKDESVKFLLVPPVSKVIERVQKQNTDYKYRRGQKIADIDDEKMKDDLFDYCIRGWEGITHSDGTPVECNRKNKLAFINHSNDLLMFLTEKFDELADTMNLAKEEGLKNSDAS